MNLASIFRRRNPARDLALIGHAKRHQRVIETAQQMRRELGLAPDPRLEAAR
jgi:hypothetical protein